MGARAFSAVLYCFNAFPRFVVGVPIRERDVRTVAVPDRSGPPLEFTVQKGEFKESVPFVTASGLMEKASAPKVRNVLGRPGGEETVLVILFLSSSLSFKWDWI